MSRQLTEKERALIRIRDEHRAKKAVERKVFLIEYDFFVEKVLGINLETAVYSGDIIIGVGGIGNSSPAGYASKTIIEVRPESTVINIPTRELQFMGSTPIKAGDRIKAVIPQYNMKNEEYLPRELRKSESAIEIQILSSDRLLLRTDRAVNFDSD